MVVAVVKDWYIPMAKCEGQLLAQMSALRDNAGPTIEQLQACAEAVTPSFERKQVRILSSRLLCHFLSFCTPILLSRMDTPSSQRPLQGSHFV